MDGSDPMEDEMAIGSYNWPWPIIASTRPSNDVKTLMYDSLVDMKNQGTYGPYKVRGITTCPTSMISCPGFKSRQAQVAGPDFDFINIAVANLGSIDPKFAGQTLS
eukprot:jgi/Botrbrau1/418/Bobra.110_2s0068.1